MVIPRRKKYRAWNPEAYAHQPLSPADRLPEDDLVFFLLDVVPQLDLDAFYESLRTGDTRPTALRSHHARLLAALLLLRRRLLQPQDRSRPPRTGNLAFLAIVGDDADTDFRTISDFRKEHLELL